MSYSVNKVIVLGNIGRDPEVRYLQGGNCACSFSVATSERWKDKNTGQQQERTEWHKVVFFGKTGEIIGEHARQGKKIYVEGKLTTRKWTDQNGQDRWTTEIIGNDFVLFDGNSGRSDAAGYDAASHTPAAPTAAASPAGADFEDDIPF